SGCDFAFEAALEPRRFFGAVMRNRRSFRLLLFFALLIFFFFGHCFNYLDDSSDRRVIYLASLHTYDRLELCALPEIRAQSAPAACNWCTSKPHWREQSGSLARQFRPSHYAAD